MGRMTRRRIQIRQPETFLTPGTTHETTPNQVEISPGEEVPTLVEEIVTAAKGAVIKAQTRSNPFLLQ